jgi:hypothetical protein
MDAKVGDEIVVEGLHTGDARREGEIREVMDRGGIEHYRVRWDDGHESVFFPGSDSRVVHFGEQRRADH